MPTIQPGLSTDIAPISNMVVRLAVVELSRGNTTGLEGLEKDLVADFYIWANRRERTYASWSPMEYSFDKPTILRWYAARVHPVQDCPACADPAELDLLADIHAG